MLHRTKNCFVVRQLILCGLVVICAMSVRAQNHFYGILRNKADSSAIPFASIHLKETNDGMLTDEKGAFKFILPKNVKHVTLEVFAIGVKTTVTYKAPFNGIDTIYADVSPNTLSEFSLKGLSAEEVVRMAVSLIPVNYADSSYFDYSFYRRYQKLNGHYVNLFEARPAVMFRISKDAYLLKANEAFAVNELRRSSFQPTITNQVEINPAELLWANPVYHLERSVIDPQRFTSYHFKFDTTNKSKDYVIIYRCNSSTDHHGKGNFDQCDLKSEAWDTGMLVIERQTFAIKKIQRKSMRHWDYVYRLFPPNNEILWDHKHYFFEFVGGDLEIDYAQRNGKWYLNKIYREYTNNFFIPVFYTRAFAITDHFEWYSDSISRYTTNAYVDKFFPVMATAIHGYDSAYWTTTRFPAFHYTDQGTVYRDLQGRDGAIDKQFYDETKVDEIKKPLKKKEHEIRLVGK